MTDRTDPELEPFLAAARARPAQPSEALMARVLAQARAHQPVPARAAPRLSLRRMLRDLGGWPAMAGLAAATVAGLGVGLAAGLAVPDLIPGLSAADESYLVDLAPDPVLLAFDEGAAR